MAKENGMEMIRARNEVNKVPSKKGKAPYTLLTGSHVLPQRYLIPKCFIDGTDSIMSVTIKPKTNTTMAMPIPVRDLLKMDSARICPVELFTLLIILSSKVNSRCCMVYGKSIYHTAFTSNR